MSWHTFRHAFSTLLKGNGEDVKVVQELLRHSTAKMTLDTYTQAPEPAEASGPKQSGRHDPLETKLYRRCTASFWRNSGNSLIRFGVPLVQFLNQLVRLRSFFQGVTRMCA